MAPLSGKPVAPRSSVANKSWLHGHSSDDDGNAREDTDGDDLLAKAAALRGVIQYRIVV
jgi:hypothetical protein